MHTKHWLILTPLTFSTLAGVRNDSGFLPLVCKGGWRWHNFPEIIDLGEWQGVNFPNVWNFRPLAELGCVAMRREELSLRIYLRLQAAGTVKVKGTEFQAKEPSASICSRLSGISSEWENYLHSLPGWELQRCNQKEAKGIEGLLRNIMVIYG
jgi:hypothetical protein